FVGGDKFFGWNLYGFAYDGIEEWATLWEFLARVKAKATLGEDEDLRVHVSAGRAAESNDGRRASASDAVLRLMEERAAGRDARPTEED
ncbi:MAG TPA: hypothetical protein VE243_05180, partial [Candidatus Acidoferrum sp.]|nr:hypothetical protein [Candidatus Acidoferrum sp.]